MNSPRRPASEVSPWKDTRCSRPDTLPIDSIESCRDQLASEAVRLLDQTEEDLEQHLERITNDFDVQLKLVAEYEENVFQPISEQRLEITTGASEKNGKARKQHATLADRMQDFENIVTVKAARLETLWKEWHATNMELVCLAIEVLGQDGVELALGQDKSSSIMAQVDAATSVNRSQEDRRGDYKEQADELGRRIHTTAKETIDNLNEQEKVRWPV
jgi:hypothetical protein